MSDRIVGIDVSYAQGNINWDAVAIDGQVKFAFIKCTEGATVIDHRAETNALGAGDMGLPFGYYHFAYPQHKAGDAEGEARAFKAALDVLPPSKLGWMLDLERNAENMGAAEYEQWVKDFISVFDESDPAAMDQDPRRIYIYGGASFLNAVLPAGSSLSEHPLWLAQYPVRLPDISAEPAMLPSLWADWTIWQYSDQANIPGIRGMVDVNFAKAEIIIP